MCMDGDPHKCQASGLGAPHATLLGRQELHWPPQARLLHRVCSTWLIAPQAGLLSGRGRWRPTSWPRQIHGRVYRLPHRGTLGKGTVLSPVAGRSLHTGFPLPLCCCSTATTAPTMQASASGASLGGRSTLQRTHASWAHGRQHHCQHHCQYRRQDGRQNGRQVRRSTWLIMPRGGRPITSSPCLVIHAFPLPYKRVQRLQCATGAAWQARQCACRLVPAFDQPDEAGSPLIFIGGHGDYCSGMDS